MTSPFSKSYAPQVDAKAVKEAGDRSRRATKNVQRYGLKATQDGRTVQERAQGKKPSRRLAR